MGGHEVLWPPGAMGFFGSFPAKVGGEQFYQQPYQQPAAPAPRSGEVRKNQRKRKGGPGKNGRRQAGKSGAGGASELAAMKRRNSRGAKRHFSQRAAQLQETPRTVPGAPLNTNSFLTGQQTPAELRGPGDRAAAEVENLDFFGTNDGLLLRENGGPGDWGDNGLSSDESDADAGNEAAGGARQGRDQLAYTLSLEQQNMHLHQENLDLREKLGILEERLKDMVIRQRQLELEEGEISEPCPSVPGAAAAPGDMATDAQNAPNYSSWEDDP